MGHFNFCKLLFVCGFEISQWMKLRYSLKDQKGMRLLMELHVLNGVLGLLLDLGNWSFRQSVGGCGEQQEWCPFQTPRWW